MGRGILRFSVVVLCVMSWSQFALAEEKDYSSEPWEKAALYLGAFVIDTNSDLELGIGKALPSVTVDAEEVLGLEKNFTVFRADGFWRITRRNRVDFTYYEMKRDGTTSLGIEIPEIEPIGARVDTDFDLSILRASYAWSFLKTWSISIQHPIF